MQSWNDWAVHSHHRLSLWSIRDKVFTSVALEHDPTMFVYTNTYVLPYNLSMIRSLFPSHWRMTHPCWCMLTPPHWLMIHQLSGPCFHRIGARATCARPTSQSQHRMNHLVLGYSHHRIAVQSICNDPLVGVSLLNDSAVIHYWYMPCHTNSCSDDKSTHIRQRQNCIRWWWQMYLLV